jgi:sulfonate transport system substrate-binding protein
MTVLQKTLALVAAVMVAAMTLSVASAEDTPSAIRMSVPGVGIGARPVTGGSSSSTMHLKGLLEQEFREEGIKVTWTFLRGAGPAVNELFANGLTDFAALGDLPSIIGRASGLKTRVLAATAVRSNLYVAVPADSNITRLQELRGKRVALTKGTATQLAFAKILETAGLVEKDVRLINMDVPTQKLAITTKDIDAAVGASDWIALRDQGVARIVFTSKGGDPALTSNTSLVASEDFIRKYPEHTKRVVKNLVLAAKWLADQEANPAPVFELWTKSGVPFSNYKEDWSGESLKQKTSPLIDPYFIVRYKANIELAKKFGLIRKPFEYEEWVDTSFLTAALRELKLESFWRPRDAQGNWKE